MTELPCGWAKTRFGVVCRLLNGRAYKKDELLEDGKYRVLRVGNLFTNNNWYFSDLDLEEEKFIESGDLIYAWSASFGPRIWDGGKVIYHYHIWKCDIVRDAVNKMFLYYLLLWDTAQIKEAYGVGTTMVHVTKGDMEQRNVALPPLPEQRRIVAKLDSLFERTRRAREELSHIPHLIANYKKAILESAFRGELIKATPYQNWMTRRIEEIAKVGTGATPKRANGKYYRNGCIPWVTSGAVNQVRIRAVEQFITEAALAETNCKVFPSGALLIAMYGEGVTRGKVAILDIHAATNQALAAIQLEKTDLVSPDYLFWFLESNYLTIRSLAAGGVQPNLNLGIIKNIPVCFPALDEQKVIVEKIESLMEWIRIVGAEQGKACSLLEQLDQAILAKAFRGELVPQDPNDEPADALLDRIRAKRAGEKQIGRTRKIKGVKLKGAGSV